MATSRSAAGSRTIVEAGKECPKTLPAVVVWKEPDRRLKGEVGQVTQVCTDAECKVHHSRGGSGQKPERKPLKRLAFVEHKAENLQASQGQRLRWAVSKALAEKLTTEGNQVRVNVQSAPEPQSHPVEV